MSDEAPQATHKCSGCEYTGTEDSVLAHCNLMHAVNHTKGEDLLPHPVALEEQAP